MITRELNQPTNPVIQEQHKLLRQFLNTKGAYEKAKQEAQNRLKHETEIAEKTWKKAKDAAEAELDQIQQVLSSAQTALSNSLWKDNVNGGTPQRVISTTGVDVNQAIDGCRSTAYQSFQEITNFLTANADPSKLKKKWGWLSTGAGCLTFVVIGIIFASASHISAFSIFGIILGLIIPFVLYNSQAGSVRTFLKNAYATLAAAVSSAEDLFRQKLQGPQQYYERQKAEAQTVFKAKNRELDIAYSKNLAGMRPAFSSFARQVTERFPGIAWNDSRWNEWKPIEKSAKNEDSLTTPITRVGTLKPMHPDLPEIPAMVACPGSQNILFKANGEGKDKATTAIEALIVRLLAIHPPSRVLFTLIDPVGSGKNVAGFIELAEHYKKLIGSKVWTDERQIDERLMDLQEQMEGVIQKLRGKFKTVEDYNAKAEVPEPYRVIVVVGFPAEFNDKSASRLLKIATNGREAGFSTIVLMDTELKRPYDFNLDDLERVATVFKWNGKEFIWDHDDFKESRLTFDTPPQSEMFDKILKEIGKRAEKADRVEVNFDRYVPQIMWSPDNRTDIEMSCELGSIGNNKSQKFVLNSETNVHVLVAGKTGAGKTNLMHVLITGLALKYHPDELELYLIDLKAVGFAPYARFKLPHARVVATESEREFALSVLQRLDRELKDRQERFKQAEKKTGERVDKLSLFRKAEPRERMPRILLIIDEFQELFTQDDSIHQEALLLLDRLIRMGRAFGMHVLLGSQTLRGAYSIAQSTMSQMSIRIAMQCDPEDSECILSSGNIAARLLSRPGSAIYNPNNGAAADNSDFQVALLSGEQLNKHLEELQAFAKNKKYEPPVPQRAFQGNANADVETDEVFTGLFRQILNIPYAPTHSLKNVLAWIGDPIALQEHPTAISFRRQPGNNVLVVGQQDEVALGMIVIMLYCLTAQYAPGTTKFYVANYSYEDEQNSQVLPQVAQSLSQHNIKILNRRTFPETIAQIADEVEARQAQEEIFRQPIYLFIYGLQRARDLRPDESFGYSLNLGSDDVSEQVNLPKRFATILREGPDFGVHTIAWCDTYNNLNRSIEPRVLRDFDVRIAFQMSPNDSNNLIDSASASKLGYYRALSYRDETGKLEKFRPYALPGEEWRNKAAEQILQKS